MPLKKFVFLTLLLLFSFQGLAQKPGLIKSRTLQSEGKLAEALKEVEAVLADPDTSGIGGAWFTYAEIHKALFENSEIAIEQEFHLTEALAGYKKTRIHQPKKTRIYLLADQVQVQMYDDLLRKGSGLLRQQNFEASANAFEYASLVNPLDSIALQYAASISIQGELYQKAIKNYKKLVLISPKVSTYQSIIGIQKDRMKSDSLALITIKEAREVFPDQYEFKRYELDIYLKTRQNNQARLLLTELMEDNPTNAQFALQLAVLNDNYYKEIVQNGETDSTTLSNAFTSAAGGYMTAVQLNPKDITANFNLAMLYTDEANKYYRALNNMTLSDYKLNVDIYEEKAKESLSTALPYMETAYNLQPKSPDILKSLRVYYDRLGMSAKKLEIEAKMRELGINF